MKKIPLLTLPLLFGGIAHAEDKKVNFNPNDISIYGGSIKCPLIIKMLKSDNQNDVDKMKYVISYYTMGYLSALNLVSYLLSNDHAPEHVGKDLNFEYNIEYVSNYCLNHPKDGLPDAVITLIGKL